MKNLRLVLSAFCVVAAFEAVAAKETASAVKTVKHHLVSDDAREELNKWDGAVSFGYAWSMNSGLKNPNAAQFNTATVAGTKGPGFSDSDSSSSNNNSNPDNSNLGKAAYVGLSLNRRVCSWFYLGVEGNLYSPFNYGLYHSGATPATDYQNTTAGTAEVLGVNPSVSGTATAGNYARTFTLNHQSFLFNVYLTLPEDWKLTVRTMDIAPVIGAGVGAGLNRVTNFQSVGYNVVTSDLLQVTTLSLPNFKAGLAWQADIGLNFQPEGGDLSFGIGYRYYNGGKFASSDSFMLNDSVNVGNLVKLTAWEGHLKTNQVRMCLDFEF